MHFIVSQVLMKYYHDHRSRYSMAHHVALASQTIKSRVSRRLEYRRILWDAGQTASQSGARASALWYFRHCIALLQDDCWNELKPDVHYDETLRLFIATAEMSWSQGQNEEAIKLIDEVFAHGKDAVSKSRAWIIKAKIFAQVGDHHRSMEALLTCLDELGVHLRKPTTYEECDAAYLRLKSYLETADLSSSIAQKPISQNPTVMTIGAVMAEAMTVTYWDDALTFYRMALEVMNIHIFQGGFTQIAIGCSHLAMISMSRFKDVEYGSRLSDLSLELLERCPELWTQSRGSIVHNLYVSHLRVPMASTLPALEASLEASFSMGDPYLTLISISSMAMTRLYLGQDMTQLEAFCIDTPEEIPMWQQDTRGGASLIAVQQVARALQGKTNFRSADDVMSDAEHNTSDFMMHLDAHSSNADRPRDIYWGLAMIPLFLFGHHTRAIEVGTQLLSTRHRLWSARVSYVIQFYLATSLLMLHNDNPAQGYLDGKMDTLLDYKAEIDFARNSSEANYGMWAMILEALIAEVRNDHSASIQGYEAAIDHCQIHGWPLEEALALELQGEFLVRRGAKRAARAVIQEAISAWSSISATGKSMQLAEKHEWLLKTATSAKTVDVGCQTMDSLLEIGREIAQEEILMPQQMEEDERRQHWIEQNGVTTGERSNLDISSVGLDIIDLSSILESSQVMSSELQIDRLFTKMLEIILESCNGSDFAIIATDFDDNGFAIAAAGDAEKGQKSFPEGLPFSEMEDRMALHISHYVMRTKEEVLVHNVLEDERFSNVSDTYLANFPAGRSVIALPVVQGDRLLGVIHLEGKPHWFTQRNVVVLHLLCNQVGISLSNALLFREIRKVSAKNASMIESQKRALALAREAEQKAKNAEAEAKHNVKLKEDAARAKSIFLANISHDLRTPMNGVIGLSELLKGTPLDKEQDEYVESIRVCADTLLTLINDILDFSKLEAGKMKISTVPLNLRETISEVIRALRYTHRDRGLATIENLDKVPPELVVLGDPVRLHQIFMNLLSNSYKFTPTGSVTVRARVAREGKGRVRLECSVTDTGIGIPDEQKARLFRPFSQADPSTERSYGGSGLGLSICKAIIEDVLGGAIWLESTSGVGTTVTFHLVFNKAPKKTAVQTAWSQELNKAEKKTRRSSARDLTQIPRDQIRVCIAEDNPINQKIAVKFVTGLGLQCEAYSDGKQAVDALRARSQEGNPFHVVLMDVMMPTLDGYNATRELRRDPDPNVNEVLVIAMTASAIEGDREKCLEAGMNNYLPKPVRSPILSELLDTYLAPVPSYPKSRLAIREKRSRASMDAGAGTPTSFSSSSSDELKPLSLEKK
jgi:signal transduction histidine kinase/CheY-like chemotaxis protein